MSLTLEQVDAMTRLIGNYPESTSMAKTSSGECKDVEEICFIWQLTPSPKVFWYFA